MGMKPLEAYEGHYVKISPMQVIKAERNTHIIWCLAFLFFAFVFWDAGLSTELGFLFFIFLVLWLLGMTIMVLRHRKIYVLTEEGNRVHSEDLAQQEIELEAKKQKHQKFFELWYIRYLIAICMFGVSWWLLTNPRGSQLASLLGAGFYAIWGAYLSREVSKYVIGALVLYFGVSELISSLDRLTTPSAILIGSIIIAYAIYVRKYF